MLSKSVIFVVNPIVVQWLKGGVLNLTFFVGLLVCRIFGSKISLKVTNWRKRRRWGTHLKVRHNLVTFYCNLSWLKGGVLNLTFFVGLLVCRIFGSKVSLKVTNWRKRRRWGTHLKICHSLVKFLCNLSWLKIVFPAILHRKITRRISRNNEMPKSFPTSMNPRNSPDIDILHGFKCAPKILQGNKYLAYSGQRQDVT